MTNGQLIERLREHFSLGLDNENVMADYGDVVMSAFDRAALRAIVEAHEPPAPELTPQQRGGRTRKANRLAREKAQAKEALNGKAGSADSTLSFPGSPTGAA